MERYILINKYKGVREMENRINNSNRTVTIKRGDIYFANLGKGIGSVQSSLRPILIITNNIANIHSPVITVAPFTSQSKSHLPVHVLVEGEGLEKASTLLLEQIQTIDKSQLLDKIGCCTQDTMTKIDKAIQISLGLSMNSNHIVKDIETYRNKLEPQRFDLERVQGISHSLGKLERLINRNIEKGNEEDIPDLEDSIKTLQYEIKKLCAEANIEWRLYYKKIPRIIKHELVQKLG